MPLSMTSSDYSNYYSRSKQELPQPHISSFGIGNRVLIHTFFTPSITR